VGIASAFLLLCQTAAAANACAAAPTHAGEVALAELCHDAVPQPGDAEGHAQQHSCPAEHASPSFAKLDIPQAANLPGLAVKPVWQRAPLRMGLSSIALLARAEPPPLTILHCCLRN
jgi:hypothetical protein